MGSQSPDESLSPSETTFLEAITAASREERRAKARDARDEAIQEGRQLLSFVVQAYMYWLGSDPIRALRSVQFASAYPDNMRGFAALCKGHAYRHLANAAAHSGRQADDVGLGVLADGEYASLTSCVAEADGAYHEILALAQAPLNLRPVCYHGLSRLQLVRLEGAYRSSLADAYHGEANDEQKDAVRRQVAPPFIEAAEALDQQALAVAQDCGLSYAPPYYHLGQLAVLRAELLGVEGHEHERTAHLDNAENWFRAAINAAHAGQYAPPHVGLATVLFELGILRNDLGAQVAEVGEHLAIAMEYAPDDAYVHDHVRRFTTRNADRIQDVGQSALRQALAGPAHAKERSIRRYFLTPRRLSTPPCRDFILVLRRWSSYSPTVATPERETWGGGYLLDWQGFRVAVDPGHGFVRNLSQLGFNIVDIDAIVVTHGDPDHCSDLGALLGLVYERGAYAEDLSTAEQVEHEDVLAQTHHLLENLRLVLPDGVLKRLPSRVFSTWEEKSTRHSELGPAPLCLGDSIRLSTRAARNHLDVNRRASRCLRFQLQSQSGSISPTVGITGDTCYDPGIVDFLEECQVIILHLSTVDDLLFDTSDQGTLGHRKIPSCLSTCFPDFHAFYRKHLGFWGTAAFLAALYVKDPNLRRTVLVAEWGEELAFERRSVVEGLVRCARTIAGNGDPVAEWPIDVIASDVGTRVALSEPQPLLPLQTQPPWAPRLVCQFGGVICGALAHGDAAVEAVCSPAPPWVPHQQLVDVALEYYCTQHRDFILSVDPNLRAQ